MSLNRKRKSLDLFESKETLTNNPELDELIKKNRVTLELIFDKMTVQEKVKFANAAEPLSKLFKPHLNKILKFGYDDFPKVIVEEISKQLLNKDTASLAQVNHFFHHSLSTSLKDKEEKIKQMIKTKIASFMNTLNQDLAHYRQIHGSRYFEMAKLLAKILGIDPNIIMDKAYLQKIFLTYSFNLNKDKAKTIIREKMLDHIGTNSAYYLSHNTSPTITLTYYSLSKEQADYIAECLNTNQPLLQAQVTVAGRLTNYSSIHINLAEFLYTLIAAVKKLSVQPTVDEQKTIQHSI